MNQLEAAEYVGITPQMLRLYTKQGRVKADVDKTKSRRTLVYEAEELDRLKVARAERQKWKLASTPSTDSHYLTLNLDGYYQKKLEEAAAKREMSAGQYARFLVMQALEDRTVEAISTQAKEQREDLAKVALALLILAGNQNPDEAREWVNKNVRRKE